MPDSPVHAHMLTKEERIAAIERVRDDQGGTENKRWKREQIIEAATDIRTWLIVLTTFLSEYRPLRWDQIIHLQLASIPNGGLSNCMSSVLPHRMHTNSSPSQQYYC